MSVVSVVTLRHCLVKPGRSSTFHLFLGCDAAQDVKARETFMSADDPRAAALKQRPKLSSSLAVRVNADSSEQCLEDAWKVRSPASLFPVLIEWNKASSEGQKDKGKTCRRLRLI